MRTIRSVCAAEQPCNDVTLPKCVYLSCTVCYMYIIQLCMYVTVPECMLHYSNVCSSSSSCPFPSEGNRALVTLPKCSRVLRSVTSSVNIPSTMETSVLLSKLGGLDTTGTPNLNQCLRPKL